MNRMGLGVLALLAVLSSCCALDNGLVPTPPMGWMSWLHYECHINCSAYPDGCINEELFRDVADMLVSEGYADVGYEYVIIDDCWLSRERDSNGYLQADPERFPSGIKALADYIHDKGLKFGIYEDIGTATCQAFPGLYGYYDQDAQMFADWGVDYIKVDGCYRTGLDFNEVYPEFGRSLNKTGRPIVYSCSWPAYLSEPNYTAIEEACNLWRNEGDIANSWSSVKTIINIFANKQDEYVPHAGPGHWNDPDMLVIGNTGLNLDESQAQMAIWSVLAAPLLMSNDLHNISADIKEVLVNQKVIEINQDPLGIQGRRVLDDTENKISIWTRPITPVVGEEYSYAVAVLSFRSDETPYNVDLVLADIGLTNTNGYLMENLFKSGDYWLVVDPSLPISVSVNPSGVIFYKAVPNTSERL